MGKIKTKFVCTECGYESPKWLGKCPGCNEWNTLTEEKIVNAKDTNSRRGLSSGKIEKIEEISYKQYKRIKTGSGELDRVLGGGIVKGSLVLVGGDPGIGKSTLLLQIANYVAKQKFKVLYVSGEESAEQIKLRADRLGVGSGELYVLAETNIEIIKNYIDKEKPDILILDSIQTVYSPDIVSTPGSVSQVKEITSMIMRITKAGKMASFIVGHVTKQGAIAGPRVLEHIVDTVLYFEGERHYSYRILRAVKNRFGSTNEIGILEMMEKGLVEVKNPSEIFLEGRPVDTFGTAVTASMEGTRPLLIEVQALVSFSSMGIPRRITTGIDNNRAAMLLAVLEKKAGLAMQNTDAFINITGGLQLKEPAADLAVICSLASSFKEKPIDSKTILIGEVGLTGELRGVSFIGKRLREAQKMGFEKAIIAKANFKAAKEIKTIKIIYAENISEALDVIFL